MPVYLVTWKLAIVWDLLHKLDQLDGWALENKVNTILGKMELDPNADLADLSGGRKRRVLLARTYSTRCVITR